MPTRHVYEPPCLEGVWKPFWRQQGDVQVLVWQLVKWKGEWVRDIWLEDAHGPVLVYIVGRTQNCYLDERSHAILDNWKRRRLGM